MAWKLCWLLPASFLNFLSQDLTRVHCLRATKHTYFAWCPDHRAMSTPALVKDFVRTQASVGILRPIQAFVGKQSTADDFRFKSLKSATTFSLARPPNRRTLFYTNIYFGFLATCIQVVQTQNPQNIWKPKTFYNSRNIGATKLVLVKVQGSYCARGPIWQVVRIEIATMRHRQIERQRL